MVEVGTASKAAVTAIRAACALGGKTVTFTPESKKVIRITGE